MARGYTSSIDAFHAERFQRRAFVAGRDNLDARLRVHLLHLAPEPNVSHGIARVLVSPAVDPEPRERRP